MNDLICKAVLFDLDGVLVQSGHAVERSWRRWALRHEVDPDEVLRICHGQPSAKTISVAAPQLDVRAEAEQLEAEQALDTRDLSICPGADRLVRELPECRWAVVTSGTRLLAGSRLQSVGLPIPKVLITADDVQHGKPAPEGYLLAAARLATQPVECVVVEDARPGVLAARAAGMRVIGVAGPGLGPVNDVDIAVDTLAELRLLMDNDHVIHLRVAGAPGGR